MCLLALHRVRSEWRAPDSVMKQENANTEAEVEEYSNIPIEEAEEATEFFAKRYAENFSWRRV